MCVLLSASFLSVYPFVFEAAFCLQHDSAIQNVISPAAMKVTQWSASCPGGYDPSQDRITPRQQSLCFLFCIWIYVCERDRVPLITVCMWNCLSDEMSMNCVFLFVCACQWPRGTAGPRNYLNGHSCISIATGCFNGGALWAREQGNDRSGRRNALILSQWQEGMLPLSDGLIAPALIDRQPRPLRSPGNTGPPLPHTHTGTHKSATLLFSP